jgi:hypothetical protein
MSHLKAALDAAIKHGAPRGSMELAKLAEASGKALPVIQQLATYLRIAMLCEKEGVKMDDEMKSQAWALLAQWETL